MNKSEWTEIIDKHWDDLKSLVMDYHPRANYNPQEMPITAEGAEMACEVVRRQIASEGSPVTEDLLENLKSQGNADELMSLFGSAWFGVPESTSCWSIPGFREMCNLLEDPLDEEE